MDIQSEESKSLNQREHNSDANSKRILVRAQDAISGDWVNISASENVDGTYSLNMYGKNSIDQPLNIQQIGTQPDGDNVAMKADGEFFREETPLGANGVYTSDWYDTDGFRSLNIMIVTDQQSATDGVKLEYTANVQDPTPNVKAFDLFTFNGVDIAKGFKNIILPPTLDGFRVVYTNGAIAQTDFNLLATGRVNVVEAIRAGINERLSDATAAITNRSVLTGKDLLSGQYNNLTIAPVTNDAGTYYSMPSIDGGRPSDVPGRTSVRKHVDNVTVDTQIHTNTTDKTFFMTDLIMFITNSNNAAAVCYLRDGTTAAGDVIIPIRVESTQGTATRQTTFSHTFKEPVRFSTGVFYDEVNDVTASITICGYEE